MLIIAKILIRWKNTYGKLRFNEAESYEMNRVVNGYIADSRPWYTVLGMKVNGKRILKCGGALISHRFIL